MIFEIVFFAILLAVLCSDFSWQRFDLNVRPIARPLLKFTIFAACLLGFMIIWGDPTETRRINRAFHDYAIGAFILIFAKGPRIGNLEPISTRPIMVLIGISMVAIAIFPILGRW